MRSDYQPPKPATMAPLRIVKGVTRRPTDRHTRELAQLLQRAKLPHGRTLGKEMS